MLKDNKWKISGKTIYCGVALHWISTHILNDGVSTPPLLHIIQQQWKEQKD